MFIDTHCHVLSEYYDNIDEVIERAFNNGVTKIIINGCDMKSNLEVLKLTKKYDGVYGAIGFHPEDMDGVSDNDLVWIAEHINDDKIVAVGEIGLDYHYDNIDREKQIDLFKKQLEIARNFNKPVIVHSRDCIGITYNILEEAGVKGVIHCYSGSVEMAHKFVKMGFLLGVGGIITFKNAKNIISVINDIDLEYILLETDSPYLTPEPYRKLKNEPFYVPVIAKKVAEVKGVTLEEVSCITSANAKRVFDIS